MRSINHSFSLLSIARDLDHKASVVFLCCFSQVKTNDRYSTIMSIPLA